MLHVQVQSSLTSDCFSHTAYRTDHSSSQIPRAKSRFEQDWVSEFGGLNFSQNPVFPGCSPHSILIYSMNAGLKVTYLYHNAWPHLRTMSKICTELPYRLMLGRRIMLKASAEYQPDCRTDRCRVIAYAKAHTAVYAKGITKLMV